MDLPLSLLFGLCFALMIIGALLGFGQSIFRQRTNDMGRHANLDKLLSIYLVGYLPAVFASEYLVKLQYDKIYDVYKSLDGIASDNIPMLNASSYFASAIFGTLACTFADRFGRRRFVLIFCLLNIFTCILVHFDSFICLLFSRIILGIQMSILFSCFECWLFTEYKKREMYVPEVLHILAFTHFCTGIFGLLGGIIDQFVDLETFLIMGKGIIGNMRWGGPLLSYDISVLITFFNIFILRCLWNENYGLEDNENDQWGRVVNVGSTGCGLLSSDDGLRVVKCESTLFDGVQNIYKDKHIFLLGVVSLSIDASFYIFFFTWSNYVKTFAPQIQLDLVFAILILCYMFGASVCPLVSWPTLNMATTMTNSEVIVPEKVNLHPYFIIGTFSLFPAMFLQEYTLLVIFGFMLFSFCAGVLLPSVSIYKCTMIPDSSRVTVYNLYRSMAFILITLVFIWELHMTSLVIICSLLQLLGAGTSYILRRKANLLHGSGKGNRGSINNGSIQGNVRPGGGNIDNRINNRNHLSGGGGGIEERAGLLNNNGNDFMNEDPSWIDSESREIH